MLDYILYGLSQLLQVQSLLAMIAGVLIGIVVGGLPGLSVTIAIALILPFTFGMDPTTAMLMLVAVYCAGTYGGSVAAVMLSTPGTAASAATVADGFALTKQGRAGEALGMSLYASVIGGLISAIFLLFLAPQIASFALSFGPPEYFTLALFGLTVIASVSGKSLSKALVMACLGILISTIGLDPITGNTRLTFDTLLLMSGIGLIPALLGLFAIAEILNQTEKGTKTISVDTNIKKGSFSGRNVIPFSKTIFKSSIIGSIIGAIPGTGGAISSFISVNEARRVFKHPDRNGTKNLDGVAAAESGNNSTTGTTLIPMMTLGVPGDVVTGVLLGALLIQGLQPGPELFKNHSDFVYTVMVGVIAANILMFIIGKMLIRWVAKISIIPSTILFPIVLVFCLIGSYAYDNSLNSVWIAIFFGLIGYIMLKFEYPIIPMLIGIILGPLAETSFRQSLILSDDSIMIFFQRPISLIFIFLIAVSILVPIMRKQMFKLKKD